MAVDIDTSHGEPVAGVPHALFQTRIVAAHTVLFQYAVSRDGSRFLINSMPSVGAAPPDSAHELTSHPVHNRIVAGDLFRVSFDMLDNASRPSCASALLSGTTGAARYGGMLRSTPIS
jgi:hypothetical protein